MIRINCSLKFLVPLIIMCRGILVISVSAPTPFHSPCNSSVLAPEHPGKAPVVALKSVRWSGCHTRSFCVFQCYRKCDKDNDLGFKIKCSRAYAFLYCFCSSSLIARGGVGGISSLSFQHIDSSIWADRLSWWAVCAALCRSALPPDPSFSSQLQRECQ